MRAGGTTPGRRWRGRLAAAIGVAVVGAIPAPAGAAARATPDRAAARDALDRAIDARQGVRGAPDVTIANRDLAVAADALGTADRRRARALMARPTDSGADADTTLDYGGAANARTCSARFCIHWVTAPGNVNSPDLTDATGADGTGPGNGVPDYVDLMLREFERVASYEQDTLHWPAPVGDGTRGSEPLDGKTGPVDAFDVYVGDIGDDGIYGYAQPESPASDDPGEIRYSAYMAMDDDYSAAEFPGYSGPTIPLEVTAAHEYDHVLQFGIDTLFDAWFGEATATWMEDQVYPQGDDWLQYLRSWQNLPGAPITAFTDATHDESLRPYGTSVLVHWIADQAAFGPATILDAWRATHGSDPADFSAGGLSTALQSHGGATFSGTFGAFAAASAEWRASDSTFHDHALYAGIGKGAGVDVHRETTTLTPGGSTTTPIDHTAYRLFPVDAAGAEAVRLTVTAPAGVASSIALVGRTGTSLDGGTTTIRRTELPTGGTGSVLLPSPGSYGRVTAVVTNTDTGVAGFDDDPDVNDWVYSGDADADHDGTVDRRYAVALAAESPAPPPATTTPVPAPAPVTPTSHAAPATTPATPVVPRAPSAAAFLTPLRTTAAQFAAALGRHGIARLRTGVPGVAYAAPAAGRLSVSVVLSRRTAATGTARVTAAGKVVVRVRASRSGAKRLARRARQEVVLVVRFTPDRGAGQVLRRTVTIRR